MNVSPALQYPTLLISFALMIVAGPAYPGWVPIPAGSFRIGCVPRDKHCSPDEKPRHRVRLTKPFELMATEATVGMLQDYATATKRRMPPQPDDLPSGPDHPAVALTFAEAMAFCEWIGGRLPTEAEWEYAARAGGDSVYPWGNDPVPMVKGRPAANISDAATDRLIPNPYPTIGLSVRSYDDGYGFTSPVRAFPPNKFGLYDVGGNASEWVDADDTWGGYEDTARTDPPGSHKSMAGILRGGAWNSDPRDLRASKRIRNDRDIRLNFSGVRCAR